jgi:hypothetical protein
VSITHHFAASSPRPIVRELQYLASFSALISVYALMMHVPGA